VLRWTARVAKLKAQAANAERALRLLEAQREATRGWLMVHNPTALALIDCPGGIDLGAPDRVLVDNARIEWTHLAEELELAERIARLLERPRASAAPKAAASPPAKPATRFGVTQGGKR
jgi:hypothetical protein